jgi:histidyl-tRNA synthetase
VSAFLLKYSDCFFFFFHHKTKAGHYMALRPPTGTTDLLPLMALKWQLIQKRAAAVFTRYGYLPIDTPTFEHLEVFVRGIGEATDVVGKEMFLVFSQDKAATFKTAAEQSIKELVALRPESTAGVCRAIVTENMLPPGASALKLYYAGSMFRHEKPQKGRLREFHQIGAECIGAAEPSADAEVIEMLMRMFVEMGIPREKMRLRINSMGDSNCRPAFRQDIREFILDHPELCPECLRRADTNPLRAFDCKSPQCQAVLAMAPSITESLCPDCDEHYATVKRLLDAAQIDYIEDPRLVRGLDYYTRTVFEVEVTSGLGSQNAIGGGGRYDGLIEEFGGKPTPGLGFAVGFERIVLALDDSGEDWAKLPSPDVYITAVDESCRDTAYTAARLIRDAGLAAEMDHQGRSLKAQFKAANKLGVSWVVVIGPDELAEGRVTLRQMSSGEERKLSLAELAAAIVDSSN